MIINGNNHMVELKKRCFVCGGKMLIDTSMILTTLPPQYKAICQSCGGEMFLFCSEVNEGDDE